ncbi:MAG: hypothetical protein NTW21_42340 [Verrucomicrobia bacterium]|nr:hypothetical protein [Verrucomicrobiota bacterium]
MKALKTLSTCIGASALLLATRFSILDGSGASLGLSQLGKEVTGSAQSGFVQSDGTGGNAANYVKFSNLTSASVPTNFRVRVGEGAYPLINGVQIVNTASANPPTHLASAVVPGIGAVGVPFTVTVEARDADGLSAAAAELFEHDAYGPKPQIGYCPWPTEAADCNTVFNQTAPMYREAFALRVADSRKAFPCDLPKQSLFSHSVSQRFGILSE